MRVWCVSSRPSPRAGRAGTGEVDPSRHNAARVPIVAVCVAVLLSACSVVGSRSGADTQAAGPRPTATPSTPSHRPARDLAGGLARAAAPLMRTGRSSVAVQNLATGDTGWYGSAGHRFPTASIVKLDILATLLLDAQDDGNDLTAGERRLSRRMIEHSDNAAATALWHTIDGADGLAAANTRFGLHQTTPGRGGYWGLTTTTAADQLRLLRTVFTAHSVLHADARRYARRLMLRVEKDQRFGISAAADRSTDVALKNGWLLIDRTGRWTVNSVGLVVHNRHRLLLSVLCDGQATEAAGVSLAGALATAAGDVAAPPAEGATRHPTTGPRAGSARPTVGMGGARPHASDSVRAARHGRS